MNKHFLFLANDVDLTQCSHSTAATYLRVKVDMEIRPDYQRIIDKMRRGFVHSARFVFASARIITTRTAVQGEF